MHRLQGCTGQSAAGSPRRLSEATTVPWPLAGTGVFALDQAFVFMDKVRSLSR